MRKTHSGGLDEIYASIAAALPAQEAAYASWLETDTVDASAMIREARALGLTVDVAAGTVAYAADFKTPALAFELWYCRHGKTTGNTEPRVCAGEERLILFSMMMMIKTLTRHSLSLSLSSLNLERIEIIERIYPRRERERERKSSSLVVERALDSRETCVSSNFPELGSFQGYVDEPSNALNEIGLGQAEDVEAGSGR